MRRISIVFLVVSVLCITLFVVSREGAFAQTSTAQYSLDGRYALMAKTMQQDSDGAHILLWIVDTKSEEKDKPLATAFVGDGQITVWKSIWNGPQNRPVYRIKVDRRADLRKGEFMTIDFHCMIMLPTGDESDVQMDCHVS
jgi:hypothetical protein